MSDFDDFDDKDIFSDTFDLLEDIKAAGYDLKKSKFFNTPIEKIFESPFFTRNRNRTRGDSSTPRYPTFSSKSSKKSSSTTESSETDSGDEIFHTKSFKRSDSTYSTSSHDTTSSGETMSDASSTRSNPRKVSITRQIPVQHFVTSNKNFRPGQTKKDSEKNVKRSMSQEVPVQHFVTPNKNLSNGVSRKIEEESKKSERHSMPPEHHSRFENETNDRRHQSMSPKPVSVSQTNDSSQCFRSKSIDLLNKSEVNSSHRDRSKSNTPELCNISRYGQSKSLPDVLKNDRMSLPPNVPKVGCEKGEQPTWDERQGRIEGALKWLRSELGLLRAQDKVLLSQLKRCQDTIEVIKKQRSEEMEEGEEEEEGHWEDWEIAEFDRRCKEGEIIDDISPSFTRKAMDIPPKVAEVTS
ncbi:uncharacterized protein LOC134253574 [Saccostrea cucullata]|uniref:uncharacterized protein LOC134253574 n=1 Tax=Saccostrea cuccullata TaxID=36930 RepID=UPI002ED3CA7E